MTELFKGEIKVSLMFEDVSLYEHDKDDHGHDDSSKSKKKKKKKDKSKTRETPKIHLHIIEGIDLPAADKDGLLNPFCKWYDLFKITFDKK